MELLRRLDSTAGFLWKYWYILGNGTLKPHKKVVVFTQILDLTNNKIMKLFNRIAIHQAMAIFLFAMAVKLAEGNFLYEEFPENCKLSRMLLETFFQLQYSSFVKFLVIYLEYFL